MGKHGLTRKMIPLPKKKKPEENPEDEPIVVVTDKDEPGIKKSSKKSDKKLTKTVTPKEFQKLQTKVIKKEQKTEKTLTKLEEKSEKELTREPADEESFSALAFKIMTDPFVGKLAFFRVYSGTLEKGSYVMNSTKGKKERVGRTSKKIPEL